MENNNTKRYWSQGHTPQSHKQSFENRSRENVINRQHQKPEENQNAGGENSPAESFSKERGYKKLFAWQKADELAFQVYKATEMFPREETYGVKSQLRRAALSVPTNLVEGNGRQGRKEFKQYVNIALGSLSEVEYLLDFSLKLGYFSTEQHEALCSVRNSVGGLLWKLHKSIAA